jgi:hypothetical protein
MAGQADRLSAQGVQLLRDGPNHSWLYLAFCDAPEHEHEIMKMGLAAPGPARDWAAERRELFEQDLANCPEERMFISGEELSRLPSAGAKRLLAAISRHCDLIDVVCCVRAPIDYAISDAQESLKGGLTFDDVVRNPSLPVYSQALGTYAALLGNQRVRTFPFRKCGRGGLLRDFCRIADLDLAPPDTPVEANVSLSAEAAHILSRINERVPMFLKDCVNPARANIPLHWLNRIGARPFGLPRDARARIHAGSAGEREWLASFVGERWFDSETPEDFPWEPLEQSTKDLLDGVADVLHQAALTIEEAMAEVLVRNAERALDRENREMALEVARAAQRMRPSHRSVAKILGRIGATQASSVPIT